jgi:hypothetical protein
MQRHAQSLNSVGVERRDVAHLEAMAQRLLGSECCPRDVAEGEEEPSSRRQSKRHRAEGRSDEHVSIPPVEIVFPPVAFFTGSLRRAFITAVHRGVVDPFVSIGEVRSGASLTSQRGLDTTDAPLSFVDPRLPNACRVLYVLLAHGGFTGGGDGGAGVTEWVSWDLLRPICCQGSEPALVAALRQLLVARLAAVNISKRQARALL